MHTGKTRNTQTAVGPHFFFFSQCTTQINYRLRRNNNLMILKTMLSTKNMQISNKIEIEHIAGASSVVYVVSPPQNFN